MPSLGCSRAARVSKNKINKDILLKLQVLWQALLEQKQVLSCSSLVKIGRNCTINPHSVILGPDDDWR